MPQEDALGGVGLVHQELAALVVINRQGRFQMSQEIRVRERNHGDLRRLLCKEWSFIELSNIFDGLSWDAYRVDIRVIGRYPT